MNASLQTIARKSFRLAACAAILLPSFAFAQDAAATAEAAGNPLAQLETIISIGIGLFIAVLALLAIVLSLLGVVDYMAYQSSGTHLFPSIPFKYFDITRLWEARAASAGQQTDSPLDHNYDGIVELDNAAPPLFNYILYGTIGFAAIYLVLYHFGYWNLQMDEYNNDVQTALVAKTERMKKMANLVDENSVKALTDGAALADGKSIYLANCAACHGKLGEGLVGPNFTDEYWIHGGGIKNVFKTIKYGVPDKGMIAWQAQLNPAQMANVASYILTLAGTNPPNPKAPQGEVWKDADAPAAADSTQKAAAPQDSTAKPS